MDAMKVMQSWILWIKELRIQMS